MRRLSFLGPSLVAATTLATADERIVPSAEYPTIQSAIGAASNSDVMTVIRERCRGG